MAQPGPPLAWLLRCPHQSASRWLSLKCSLDFSVKSSSVEVHLTARSLSGSALGCAQPLFLGCMQWCPPRWPQPCPLGSLSRCPPSARCRETGQRELPTQPWPSPREQGWRARGQGLHCAHDLQGVDCTGYLKTRPGKEAACALEHKPICGTDGTSYSNPCAFCTTVA